MLSTAITLAAETSHGEPAIHPYAVGAIALGLLLLMLLALVAFAGGREHS
jgi:acyl dehydratase